MWVYMYKFKSMKIISNEYDPFLIYFDSQDFEPL